jgi:signal transduction histidine kinase
MARMTGRIIRRLQSTKGARYIVAIVALIVAAALARIVVQFHLPRQATGYAFLLVIMGSAWWGGYGPGLLTTLATILLGPYLIQPTYSIRHPNLASLPQAVIISVLISRMAGARRKLGEANAMLDERVRQRTAELEMVNRSLRDREELLVAQAERLSESNADLEQFAYFASHDLQEPLRMIAIYTEMLHDIQKTHPDADAAMCVGVVRQSVRRLEALVQDLLTYSRVIHSDQLDQNKIDLREAIGIVTTNLKSRIDEAGAEIVVVEPATPVAHPAPLIQVFQNLISNALKYRSSTPPRITVTAAERGNDWIFSVEDNGIGINPDFHRNIFIPFKRLHGPEYSGSGVGLAICRRVVERLGGEIWVESAVGAGSTFFFRIPAAALKQTPNQVLSPSSV